MRLFVATAIAAAFTAGSIAGSESGLAAFYPKTLQVVSDLTPAAQKKRAKAATKHKAKVKKPKGGSVFGLPRGSKKGKARRGKKVSKGSI